MQSPIAQYGAVQTVFKGRAFDFRVRCKRTLYGWTREGCQMGLFLLIGIGVLIYLFVANKDRLGFGDGLIRETPLEILKKRYAKGEITREQFEKMKNDLNA
jgi:uncharacterized membrane protein